MKVQGKQFGKIALIEIEGEVDAEHCAQLKRALAKAKGEDTQHFILDLNKVGFIDSTGLGILISLLRYLNEKGGKLRLTGLQDEVRSIFEITRLFRVFDISKSVEDAMVEIKNS